jgi:Berberine and berberine like
MTDDEGAERVRSTYEANLARLTEVKRRYDPDNFLQQPEHQAVGNEGKQPQQSS